MDKEGDFLPPQTGTPQNSARFRGIMDFLLIVRDRWIWGFVIALPISLLFAYKQLNVPKEFSAQSTFRLKLPKQVLNLTPVERNDFSKPVLSRHVEHLNSKEFRKRLLAATTDEESEAMLKPYKELNATKGLPVPSVAALLGRYSVSMGGTHTPLITVRATSQHDGQAASIIANKVQDEYMTFAKTTRHHSDTAVMSKLREMLDQMSTEERATEEELEVFRSTNNIVSILDARQFIIVSMQELKGKIGELKIEKLTSEAVRIQIDRVRLGNKSAGLPPNYNMYRIAEIAGYGNVAEYRNSIARLERDKKQLEDRYLERHPRIQENLSAIQEFKNLLDEEIQLAEQSFTQSIQTAIEQIKYFEAELQKVQLESQDLSKVEIQYNHIKRVLDAKLAKRTAIHSRISEIDLLQQIEESSLVARDRAGTPTVPDSPNPKQIISRSIGVFFLALLFVPIGLEFLDNRVKSPWDIEVFIGRDILAGIPRISLVSETNRPLIVAQDLDESLVESFRGLYSRIQMNSDNIYPKSILVTSAIPSEGKSLLAANLAHSFANHGRKTLLVDFDLRRPGLHKFCGLSNDRGLLTFVQELQANPAAPLNMEDIPEVYPNLRLLPSGGKTRTATELLEKMAFTNLLIKLKREFDVLLLDSSPVGLFPDSNALATKVDDLIFVTRYSKVGRRTAKSMLQKLEETGARILGVVLNDLPEKKSSSYYYNYGYYGYGYGYYRYKYYSKYYGDESASSEKRTKPERRIS